MNKAVLKLCVFVLACTLGALTAIGVLAAGTGADPLISLSYMNKVVKAELTAHIYAKVSDIIKPGSRHDYVVDKGESVLEMYPIDELAELIAGKLLENVDLPAEIPGLDAQREITLDKDWTMTGLMGCQIIILEGSLKAVPGQDSSFIDILERNEKSAETNLTAGAFVLVSDAGERKVTFLPLGDVRLLVMGQAVYKMPISGIPTIVGNAVFDEKLSVNTAGILPKLAEMSYTWLRDGTEISGATSAAYTLIAADVGKQISVRASGVGVYSESISSPSVLVSKAAQAAPNRATLASKTSTSITITAVSGCEYKIGSGNWQSGVTFSGLLPNTEYSIYMRKTETATHKASEQSSSLKVTTNLGHPTSIVSSAYNINSQGSIISKIETGHTVEALLSSITGNEFVKVYNGTSVVSASGVLCTGYVVKLEAEGKVLQTLTVVVTGDINGDGKITLTDYVQLRSHLIGKSTLKSCYFHAADINGDGNVTLTDYVKMKSHLIGKEIIKAAAH